MTASEALEIWILLCYGLYHRAAEEDNLVCLNEYSKSTLTLEAVNEIKITKLLPPPHLKNPEWPKPVENLQLKHWSFSFCLSATPGQAAELRKQSVQRVGRQEGPSRVCVTPAVTLAMQLVNCNVGIFGTKFLRTLLCLCLFSLSSSSVTFRLFENKVIYTDLMFS